MEGWGKITQAAQYAGISSRTFRRWLKMGLRHSRLPGGTVLISRAAIDAFLTQYEGQGNEAEKISNELMEGIS